LKRKMNNNFVDTDRIRAFAGKKVLVFGLGILGGGVAVTNWLIRHGCRVTVTDLKPEKDLASSIERFVRPVRLKLGGHDQKDIRESDLVVFNPDIPVRSRYVQLAKKMGKGVENEATLFYRLCRLPIVAVTGTRGKTTTCAWIEHLFKDLFFPLAAGNSPDNPFMQTLQDLEDAVAPTGKQGEGTPLVIVNELPSYHLEYFHKVDRAPEIAVVTNIFQDHLNRHASLDEYVDTKANVFKHQRDSQLLILNDGNKWTDYLVNKANRQQILFFSTAPLPVDRPGLYYDNGVACYRETAGVQNDAVLELNNFIDDHGGHNLENLLAGALVAHRMGVPWPRIQMGLDTLPQIAFRQEVIFKSPQLTVVNDNAATSPDGSMAAVDRFGGGECILITGGTDRELDYAGWGGLIKNRIPADNLIFLEGSATQKMLGELTGYARAPKLETTLEACFAAAWEKARGMMKATIVFSPGAKSFEKFDNEFERGREFKKIVERELKQTED